VKLLAAVKQRQARIVGDEIDFRRKRVSASQESAAGNAKGAQMQVLRTRHDAGSRSNESTSEIG